MTAHAYSEDQLVEQPAKRLLAELAWSLAQPHPHPDPLRFSEPSPQPLPAGEERGEGTWVDETGLFGRETKGEVVLVSRLRAALKRLNPALPPEAITAARLFERMAVNRWKLLISSRFLFELKTSQ